ncbi:LamG-like jellyroll fold domain-containing protein [Aestuariivivens insulae]|uniref:LamG-like jellyroll fold domain-containing protein n=1 Tax=Aestuariivivens insulae TaxID=1621988 RepID=UPI001F5A0B7B|nr:LamG-like jellyroll fold domain-containing protein [Aestuariivivens insulae]
MGISKKISVIYLSFVAWICYSQEPIDSLKTIPVELLGHDYSVSAEINGEPLKEVSWIELPGKRTTGVFTSNTSKLTPQKRGYWFSPDIFNFNSYNEDTPKIFRAHKYNLREKLKIYIPLEGHVNNLASSDNLEVSNDISFFEDKKHGSVAYFNGVSSYIDLRDESNVVFNELTVSVWVKPDKIDGKLSVIGKGEVFSAKITDGFLQFTTPGIKDHSGGKRVVEPNVWTHVAFVYLPNKDMYFYANGELVYKSIASGIEQTNHSMLVGTNLWGENYMGFMSDLAVWQRALSDDEIKEVYSAGIAINENISDLLIVAVIGGVFILILIIVIGAKAKTKKRKSSNAPKKRPIIIGEAIETQYTIQCLGGFKVYNSKREDITHKFSPKRRELLLCLILYTLQEGGITSKKMGQMLWPGFSPARVKNNRSTQIKEIRSIFNDQPHIEIVYSDKKWRLKIEGTNVLDILELQYMVPNLFSYKQHGTKTIGDLKKILSIVKVGVLLPNFDAEWIDPFKARYDSFILEILTPYLDENDFEDDFLIEIIDAILVIDPLHENAVKAKIEILIRQGKHMSAQKVTEHFKRLYEQFYKEPYIKELI